MPVSTVALSNNLMSHFVARLGACRLGGFRLGFAPTRAVDIDTDQAGRYIWRQEEGPQVLDGASSWTQTET